MFRELRSSGARSNSRRALYAVGSLSVACLSALAIGSISGGVLNAKTSEPSNTLVTNAAAPHLWTCTTGTLFWETNGLLSTASVPTRWSAVGTRGDPVDALGYSPLTHQLYGVDLRHGANYDRVVTVAPSGVQSVLAPVSGLPTNQAWVAGDVDPATGTYYVSNGSKALYAIDLSTLQASSVALPLQVAMGGDLIIQNGWLWTVSNAHVNGFSLTTGATKSFATYAPFYALSAGSMWSLPAGNGMLLRWNGSGKVVKVTNLRAATAIYVSSGTVRQGGTPDDGAVCTARTSTGADNSPALSVTGDLNSALFPGSSAVVDLSLTNSYATPVTMYAHSLTIILISSNPACTVAANFVVNQSLTATVTIPGSSTKTLSQLHVAQSAWPRVSMNNLNSDQDSCQGSSLHLTYGVRYAG
jgi:hypothetical protein